MPGPRPLPPRGVSSLLVDSPPERSQASSPGNSFPTTSAPRRGGRGTSFHGQSLALVVVVVGPAPIHTTAPLPATDVRATAIVVPKHLVPGLVQARLPLLLGAVQHPLWPELVGDNGRHADAQQQAGRVLDEPAPVVLLLLLRVPGAASGGRPRRAASC
ncbi:hypothetical protein MHUMG1_00202 [Metarhizium humberi]|uniref:Uncharacterized protein n=1 Tax=Metarhizium humberi TaxID=2596975 RepID=A0A9P8MIZ7_9HYPO|nr:hypothetical protein MHUMG1_00202 [Metarhizium humberi]